MFAHDSVERLIVHLPAMNRIIFHEDDLLASLVDNLPFYMTMLTEWFVANRDHTDATSLTYLDFPTRWVWDASNRLGRIYHVHPVTRELFFFLRMLLLVVASATYFEDLRLYNGVLYGNLKKSM
jgi:hypothetical protein